MATYEEITSRIINLDEVKNFLSKDNVHSDYEKKEFIKYIVANVAHLKRNSKFAYTDYSLPSEYCVIDLETTGLSQNKNDIIEIAAIKIKNGNEIEYFDQLVKPQQEVSLKTSYLTGITNDDLESARNVDEVINEFSTFVGTTSIVGHNVGFDARFLEKNGLDLTTQITVDTLEYAQSVNLDTKNNELETLKEYYGINRDSHNALEDCRTTNDILNFFNSHDYEPRNVECSQFLQGVKFSISGSFKKISRDRCKQLIKMHGGKIMSTVGKTTNFFVDGVQIADNLTDQEHQRSSKELSYDLLTSEGYNIHLLNEDQFIELINSENLEIYR